MNLSTSLQVRIWPRPRQTLGVVALLLACGCKPDVSTPTTAKPAAVEAPARPTAAEPSAAAATQSAPAAAPLADAATSSIVVADGCCGLRLTAAQWQTEPLDLLCLLTKPGHSPEQTDASLRALTAPLSGQPEIAQVLSRGLDGQGKLLLRLAANTTVAAADALAARLRANVQPGMGQLTCEVLAQGTRSRVIAQLRDPAGERSATQRLAKMATDGLRNLPCLSRSEVINAQEEVVALELQTKTMADAKVDLPSVIKLLQAAPLANVDWPAWLKQTEVRPQANNPKVALANLIAVTKGESRSPRTARNGKVVVPAVALSGGLRCDPNQLGIASTNWQRSFERTDGPREVWALVATDAATRFYLKAQRDRVPESEEALAERLQRIRQSPTSLGVFAARGLDAVPLTLQPEAVAGGAWTLWLTDGEGESLATLANFRKELEEAGWQVAPLSTAADAAMQWLLDDPVSAGALVSDATPDTIHSASQAVGETVLRQYGLEKLTRGPVRLKGSIRASAWSQQASTLEDATAVWLDNLLSGGHTLRWQPGDETKLAQRVVVRLPEGDRAQFNAELPVGQSQPGGLASLGKFRQSPSPLPVDERLRWNNRPVGWLRVAAEASPPEALAMAFVEAIAGVKDKFTTVRWWPLSFPDRIQR